MGKEAPGHAYDINYLNVVFAISSIGLLLATIWMIWADYSREWKRYQREFAAIEQAKTREQIEQARQAVDQAELEELTRQLAEAEQELEANRQQIEEAERRFGSLSDERILADIRERELKAVYDSKKFFYEEGERAPIGKRVSPEEFGALQSEFVAARDRRIALDYEVEQLNRALREMRARRTEVEGERRSLTESIELLERKLDSIQPSFANVFRNLPVVDFIDPSIEIKQVLVQNVTLDLNFAKVPRVDRCQTCHLGIDNADYADAEQPFRTHPNLDLYVARESPHPLDGFGCTSCHYGRGRGTTFNRAAHTPRNEEQEAEWIARYGWEEDHYWEQPMYPADFSESGCLKCHRNVVHVPKAENLNRGRDLYEKAGCWGCHNTTGFENRRKVGPRLDHIVSKTTPDWAARWVRNPKAFKPSTFMPRFWNLDNNPDEAVGERNDTEVAAIVAYIFDQSDPLEYGSFPSGSADRGKELVETVGCLGCHITEESEAEEAAWYRRHGPSLAGVGSKAQPAFLYNWLKNPEHYWEETFMPNLRLSDQEAADIAAYLTSLRNEEFEQLPVPEADAASLDEISLEFLQTNLPGEVARERLAGMSRDEKLVYSGERLILRYGCFGCHDIKGFEDAQKIGVDLSDWGSKMVTRLDFGYIDIDHTRRAWLEQKLRAPRSYDRGKVKSPAEKLRMGYFGFTEEQVDDIARNVLAQVRDEPPLEAVKQLSASEDIAERGRLLIHEYNCKGCHVIEGEGGGIYETIEDPGMRPPNLNTQGAKTRADWLFHFLKEPSTVRFWINARMPTFQFTDDEANTLIRYFMALEDEQPFETDPEQLGPDLLSAGSRLLTLLRCEQCHIASAVGQMEASQLAPSFRLTGERLREEWIVRWLEDPQTISPGTQMPQFWPKDEEGNIITVLPDILDGDPMRQMEAVAAYLMRYNR